MRTSTVPEVYETLRSWISSSLAFSLLLTVGLAAILNPTIVETVAQALKLPYAAIAVKREEKFEIAEVHGFNIQEPVVYLMTHQGEVIGQLLVGRRTPEGQRRGSSLDHPPSG